MKKHLTTFLLYYFWLNYKKLDIESVEFCKSLLKFGYQKPQRTTLFSITLNKIAKRKKTLTYSETLGPPRKGLGFKPSGVQAKTPACLLAHPLLMSLTWGWWWLVRSGCVCCSISRKEKLWSGPWHVVISTSPLPPTHHHQPNFWELTSIVSVQRLWLFLQYQIWTGGSRSQPNAHNNL